MKDLLTRLLIISLLTLGWFSSVQAESTRVLIKTSMGNIELELDGAKAPESVKNFLAYVDSGFYNGTIFHRVMAEFMVQGGGFTTDFKRKKTNAPVKNEAKNGLKNNRGTVAMARTRPPHSATAQFFINHVNNHTLNYPANDGWGYAVFGKVTKGMDVVDKIAAVPTGTQNGMRNVPNTAVIINSISRL
ncbi:Peptidyl-prolyl cis-trans isomerase PpiB [hydrothermal vent metagenome]|uniref:peptidylprolyl isomerase n=1 Tax=hydrothermal vent metagenome TaxID=652676 RepID=A0A3B1AWD0_9ZZZZ